jgi:hypothetical protein
MYPLIQKLRTALKGHLKGDVADIFLIGSSVKDKQHPRDVDLIVLFGKKVKNVSDVLFGIKESMHFITNAHIEYLSADNMLKEGIFLSVLHEGISIRHRKPVSEMLGLEAFTIFSFSLENLNAVEKVRFAQALYGRKRNGLLFSEGGAQLGQGSFMAPVSKEEIFRELMKTWKVLYTARKAFVNV